MFSFLPARPGTGTTTVSVNLSVALSTITSGKVLLADFDLNCGLVGFLLKLTGQHSLADAASHAFALDEPLWRQMVSSLGKLDVLPAGKLSPGWRIEPAQIRSLLDFARRHYEAVCLDHSGNLEKYSIELLHESRLVFLVCTAELPSLHLAREKLAFLRSISLGDKIKVILNRVTKRDVIHASEVEKLLGLPVFASLSNDYRGIHKAIAEGEPLDGESGLGRQFQALGEKLLEVRREEAPERRRFVEYFSLAPARYSLSPPK